MSKFIKNAKVTDVIENNPNFNSQDINDNQDNIVSEDDLFVRVPLDETESEHLSVAPYSYWKSVFRVFIHRPAAIISLVTLLIFVLGALIIPLFAPEGALSSNISIKHLAPSADHWFGTDSIGRDLWYVCWAGARKSLGLALISSVINSVLGVLIGFIWGYFKWMDKIMINIYNFIANIPSMLVYMLLSYILTMSSNLSAEFRLVVSLTLTGWLGMAMFIRNQVLIITNREYNVASETLGTPAHRIITRNLLPYILAVIVTELSLMIPSMVSSEVSLSYFGLGLPTGANATISIGASIKQGITYFGDNPTEMLFPSLMLAIIIFSFYLMGLSLSDSLDPKKHR